MSEDSWLDVMRGFVDSTRDNVPEDMTLQKATYDRFAKTVPGVGPNAALALTPSGYVAIRLVIDPDVPPGEIRVRNHRGTVMCVLNIEMA